MRLCRAGDRSIERVAKDLDLTETALREWVQRAAIDAGNGPLARLPRTSAPSSHVFDAKVSSCLWIGRS